MSIFDPIYIDRETDTKLKSLILNRLTKDKFDDLSSHSPDEIWFIQDSELSGQPIVVDTRPVDIPTKLSEFENDVPYLSAVSWSQVTGKPTIPTQTSQLTNNSGYATSAYVEQQVIQEQTKWRNWFQTDWIYDGLTFIAREANSTVAMQKVGSAPSMSLEYTTDSGTTWSDFIIGTTTVTLENVGDKVGIRAKTTNSTAASAYNAYNAFVFSGTVDVGGNILSLLNKDMNQVQSMPSRCFDALFSEANGLVDASQLLLPTFTSVHGYAAMFSKCYTLLYAPALPATSLANYCYDYMFSECSSLVKAPYLPATSLASYCYDYMFRGCSNLTEIKLSYTGSFSTSYFSNWVNGVSASGTFYYNGSSTSRGVSAIPTGWTIQSF